MTHRARWLYAGDKQLSVDVQVEALISQLRIHNAYN